MKLIINTDGASRGNPGRAAYGFLIRDIKGGVLARVGRMIGIQTNNFAEYSAVLEALRYVKKNLSRNGSFEIEVVTDSQLIAEQLSGNYRVKNLVLKRLFNQIKVLEEEVGDVTYKSVPREENRAADLLANMALDGV